MIEDNFQTFRFLLDTQFLVKVFLLLFLVFYLFFSILLIRQVQIMANAIKTDLNPFLKFVSFLNLAAAALILTFAIFV